MENKAIDKSVWQKDFTKLYELITSQLSHEQLQEAKVLADHHKSLYGNYAFAKRARRLVHLHKSKCAGSLVGNCEYANYRLGLGICDMRFASIEPSTDCLMYGSIGMA